MLMELAIKVIFEPFLELLNIAVHVFESLLTDFAAVTLHLYVLTSFFLMK